VAATLRVHTLAKELGVPSKMVIAKCRAEGIELKNHMAAISLGLAESIREWFSSGADVTSVEVADRIDVEKVRKPRRKTPEKTEEQEPQILAAESETPASTAEAPAEVGTATLTGVEPEGPVVEPQEQPLQAPTPAETVVEEAAPSVVAAGVPTIEEPAQRDVEAPAEALEPAEAAPAVELAAKAAEPEAPAPSEETPLEEGAPAQPAEEASAPAEPSEGEPAREEVTPAGPQVVPAPAELRGPRVVRIEAPEPHRAPRPRPRPAVARAPGDRPATEEARPSTGAPRRGRKGRRPSEEEAARARSRSPRRHGTTTDVDQRVREWRDQDLLERKERLASVTGHGLRDRRAAERRRRASSGGLVTTARKEPVSIRTPITLKDFCAAVGSPFGIVSNSLMEQTGQLWTINESIEKEQAEFLALDLGIPVEVERAKTAFEELEDVFLTRERPHLEPRPPVVAILGHVDHGKTSLLDRIRETHVAAGEAGGITQHIGAYRIDHGDWHVTFVDTPGHEAFTAMRARGANLTDVVVLVVAADDGVMPQTVEAIAHAKAAGVAIVVVLNKIDLPGVDINRVYTQLTEQELTPAEWGGETDVIKTSAVTGEGVDDLIAHLSTLSELLELKADATIPAQATVIEAQMREGRGVVAQVLVREGTLRRGQHVICGPASGRIRSLRDDRGRQVKEVGPGTPVELSGLAELPAAGDQLYQVNSPSQAKSIAEEVRESRRAASLVVAPKPRTLEAFVLGEAEADVPELNVIVKADVQGSVEVLRKSLGDFPAEKARLNLLHVAVGAVTEADVQLAKASGALIIGFHVVPEERARQLADQLGVEIRRYRVIYEVLGDLHKALAGLLAPVEKEEARAKADVRQVFNVSRVGTIAGCYVTDGTVNRNHRVRLVRDGRVIVENKVIDSLKRFKDDARDVRAGLECGIKIHDFDDIKPGDVIQAYEVVEVAQELS